MGEDPATDVRTRRYRGGVRLRTTIVASIVVAVALILGAVALVLLLDKSLTHALTAAADQRSADIASQLQTQASSADLSLLAPTPSELSIVQVIDGRGHVVAASAAIQGEPPLTTRRPFAGEVVAEAKSLPVGEEGTYLLVVRGVGTPRGLLTVLVGQSSANVSHTVGTVTTLLLIGLPIIIIISAGVIWFGVGRALRPVEAIRRQVSIISAADLSQRVSVPASQDEVALLAGTMNAMLDRLDVSQQRQRQFAADASHELRSPLASMKTALEVAKADPDASAWNRASDVALAEAARLSAVVGDLLFLARSDERGPGGARIDVDLDDLVMVERDRLRTTTAMRIDVHIEAVRIRGDRIQMQRLLRNLVDNAARHAITTVTIGLYSRRDFAVLEVGNDGPPIPVGERERIFERFVRLDGSRTRSAGGSGLGLAIVKQIAEFHGGQVGVIPGERAGFEVRLPTDLHADETAPTVEGFGHVQTANGGTSARL